MSTWRAVAPVLPLSVIPNHVLPVGPGVEIARTPEWVARRTPPPRRPAESPEDFCFWRRLKRVAELPVHDEKPILKMIDALADARRRPS